MYVHFAIYIYIECVCVFGGFIGFGGRIGGRFRFWPLCAKTMDDTLAMAICYVYPSPHCKCCGCVQCVCRRRRASCKRSDIRHLIPLYCICIHFYLSLCSHTNCILYSLVSCNLIRTIYWLLKVKHIRVFLWVKMCECMIWEEARVSELISNGNISWPLTLLPIIFLAIRIYGPIILYGAPGQIIGLKCDIIRNKVEVNSTVC